MKVNANTRNYKLRIICYTFLAITLGALLIALGSTIAYVMIRNDPEDVTSIGPMLDYHNFELLPDRPNTYVGGDVYPEFKFILPAEFMREGDV